eukprot:scaffold10871_cov131-Skeletonema_dohrnii-CCMP3373.AAC.4
MYCETYLVVVDVNPPRLLGGMMNPWLIDGSDTKRSRFVSSGRHGSGRFIMVSTTRHSGYDFAIFDFMSQSLYSGHSTFTLRIIEGMANFCAN